MNQKTVDAIDRYGLILLTLLTLVTLLVYTFVHTGGLLSEYVEPFQVGYVAALGIEAAIITMSIRLGKLLRQLAQNAYRGRETWLSFVWQGLTLLFVLTVSAIANIVEGHKVKHGAELTLTTIQELDALQIVIGLVATGVIPVVVLAMTEIVSGEVKAIMGIGEASLQQGEPESATMEAPAPSVQIESLNAQPLLPSLTAGLQIDLHEEAIDFWGEAEDVQAPATVAQKPDGVSGDAWEAWQLLKSGISKSEIAKGMGVHPATVGRWIQSVEKAGQAVA